ncbi:MAG: four helix bundle protein [Patescibacteria group bacterium]|nr:four helix bundle protein [Patescibacteria group bacterium]
MQDTSDKKIKEFTDLKAWQEAHSLVLAVYHLTRRFPKGELFGLTSQMRRAAVSITSNIAEGFGRRSYKEKIQFYYLTQGSLTELKNQILIARDVEYMMMPEYESLAAKADSAHRLLQGLITKSKFFL